MHSNVFEEGNDINCGQMQISNKNNNSNTLDNNDYNSLNAISLDYSA